MNAQMKLRQRIVAATKAADARRKAMLQPESEQARTTFPMEAPDERARYRAHEARQRRVGAAFKAPFTKGEARRMADGRSDRQIARAIYGWFGKGGGHEK